MDRLKVREAVNLMQTYYSITLTMDRLKAWVLQMNAVSSGIDGS